MLKIEAIWQGETQQKIFRNLLHCMSLPGEVADLSKYLGKSSALTGVLATLLDKTVNWSDNDGLVNKSDRYLLQAPIVSEETAKFVVKNAINPPEFNFSPNLGELSNPEKGATLILQGTALQLGNISFELSGPGIYQTRFIHIAGFHPLWFVLRQNWVEKFPLGVDIILVDSTCIMALPRTTEIKLNDFVHI